MPGEQLRENSGVIAATINATNIATGANSHAGDVYDQSIGAVTKDAVLKKFDAVISLLSQTGASEMSVDDRDELIASAKSAKDELSSESPNKRKIMPIINDIVDTVKSVGSIASAATALLGVANQFFGK
ncbi:hypothetical protein CCAX7_56530 [Capsulimonas corticalis]|uniref:Uncharacterized protein n=1 Tax=Capsulimonas corticalis TaxID=2219043 RepID=A0A402D0I0_9BACT|nr:hypothetical protein [Capsulimonas corticalis]BDI33602.1 hypothetical protein CCAX7_56530 [Capsulimonas corticalis]